MKWCRTCVMPDTKPYVSFDEQGVCQACRSHRTKRARLGGIDWSQRKAAFEHLVAEMKARQAPFYDVLVPVSGGKDSITQVHRLLEHDVRILAVSVDHGLKTDIGRHNLSLIPTMGANLLVYEPEPTLHRRLMRIGLEDFGDPDLMNHTLLYAFPLHAAMRFQVPLVLLGENSAFEYGGDGAMAQEPQISREWFTRFAANRGQEAHVIAERYGIPMDRLRLYAFPEGFEQSGTRAVFMSHYFPWDSEAHLEVARHYGFQTLAQPAEGTYRTYVGIDEMVNRIHQYLKLLKFGYGRATDHASEDIRSGRLTREQAKALVRQHDLEALSERAAKAFARYLGLERQQMVSMMERYRNPQIWRQSPEGQWYIPAHLED